MAKHLSKAFLSDKDYFDARYKVTSAGCWEWQAYVNALGYGEIRRAKGTPKRYAHRVSYELHKGPIPSGLEVCHSCDNPSCVNPEHLFLGTHRDNMIDMFIKKRHSHGGRAKTSKLTEQQVRSILSDTRSQAVIAHEYGVGQSHVSRIKSREVWTILKEVA